MNPPADCRCCGLCCRSSSDTYVRVSGDDWERLGADAERVAHFIGHRAFMRMGGGHCAALTEERQSDGAIWQVCAIYERRPQVCRDLGRGSPECEAERIRKGGAGVMR
ncbi:YkgJ family cysteine cluster protein [Horticoccus luteus]|uniref:YkgJ family cysteine cluster protein n=1 Tax=Horticoccus luteus TaxID=2862869 RepID=UPI00210833A3|nr:YkgJ family cysteine cluster protein [Horticoccus luteus]